MHWAIPSNFQSALLQPDRLVEDDGALDKLFVRLVYDLFASDYPSLTYHPDGGKDGAIDLWVDRGGHRTVFECKQIGHGIKQQCWEAARDRWRTVRKRLLDNLPLGAEKCHSPYRTWFSSGPQIASYFFVASCPIFPVSHKDDLQKEIAATFASLSQASSELAHLKSVAVSVVDWNDLRGRLEASPGYLFKWFRDYSIPGLKHVTSGQPVLGFRKYQHESILPYYSIHQHLDSFPHPGFQDEQSLWNELSSRWAGLVISGVGGVGKSRLMHELGKLALQDGWLVFEALPTVTAESIESVARRHEASGVLFLFDYLESLPEFRKISLNLVQFAGDGLRVRFIASARESFVVSNEMFEESVRVFKHSPSDDKASVWWETYRKATCFHIAGHLRVRGSEELTVDVPAVTVLESELKRGVSEPEQGNAVKRWAKRRLDVLRTEGVTRKDLALVAAQCPFNVGADEYLPSEVRRAFAVLRNDGWLEMRDEDEIGQRYWMVHDYLADQIVLDWLAVDSPRGSSKVPEIRELLKLAYSLGTLGALIGTLQRILNGSSGFSSDTFSDLIGSEIAQNGDVWKLYRRDVLYTRLLSPTAKIELLYRLAGYWREATKEHWFQLEIAALAKAVATDSDLRRRVGTEALHCFQAQVLSLAAEADERNMLVTYGLRLMPDNQDLQGIAKSWLGKFGDRFGATYILRAWMDMGLSWKVVEPTIRLWLQHFGHSIDAQFVLAAWLRAAKNGGVRTFEAETLSWCSRHQHAVEAQHVFSSWLRAGGNWVAVKDGVLGWLSCNGRLEEEGSHLLRRWLRAGGDAQSILPYLVEWLRFNENTESASFVYTAAAENIVLQKVVQEPMLAWIKPRSHSLDSRACIAQWLVAELPINLVACSVQEWLEANRDSADAGEILAAWLRAKGKIEMVWQYLPKWLERYSSSKHAAFLLCELVKRETIPEEVRTIVPKWLSVNVSDVDAEQVMSAWLKGKHGTEVIRHFVQQWCKAFARELDARYLFERWVIAGGDADTIRDAALSWLSIHGAQLDAGRVFSALLKSGVSPKEYAEYLRSWAPLHKRAREASFFYCDWLNRKPPLRAAAISNSVMAWLEDNAGWSDADFVLNAWLKNDNAETQVVRAGYDIWMAKYSAGPRARIVQRNWERATERERKLRFNVQRC